ncbi:MAG TPA: amino acid ABC transporter substrate-binding protein [Methylomirabilota bacterium]|nr:amino acid ABC transporter substrate-binding protein [Methylomirabilota bacterium]
MMRTAVCPFAAVAAVALVLGAAGGPAAAQGPMRIGAALSVTGSYAVLGANQQRGYQLCAKHLNERGGVLGRKVEFVHYDDQSQPATAIKLYERLITQDKVDAILGPYGSAISEAVANVAEKYRMPMVVSVGAATSIFKKGRKYVFMVLSPAEGFLEGLVDIAARRGLKTLALVNEDTLFAKSAVQGSIELAKKKGLQVSFVEAYPKGTTDFSGLLVKVRAANPDVLGAATFFDDAVAITRQMRELNVNPKMYGVTIGGDVPKFHDLLGKNAEFVYGATQWEPELPHPGSRQFYEAYRREFPGADYSYHSAAGYAGCQLLAEAIRRTGSLDGDKLRDTLLKLEMKTVLGTYKVDPDGYQVGMVSALFQWQDGKKVIVWPDEYATGQPRFPTPPWTQR